MPDDSVAVEEDQRNKTGDSSLQIMSNGKASAVPPPPVGGDEDFELADIHGDETKLPLLEDVMQLARLGEVGRIQQLFEQGKIGADFNDKEGITPLHVRRSEMSSLFDGRMYTDYGSSGPLSITSTLYASS